MLPRLFDLLLLDVLLVTAREAVLMVVVVVNGGGGEWFGPRSHLSAATPKYVFGKSTCMGLG